LFKFIPMIALGVILNVLGKNTGKRTKESDEF
jgi:hypothetical protein